MQNRSNIRFWAMNKISLKDTSGRKLINQQHRFTEWRQTYLHRVGIDKPDYGYREKFSIIKLVELQDKDYYNSKIHMYNT